MSREESLIDVQELLLELRDYMDERADVEDGENFEPVSNREMRFSYEITAMCHRIENLIHNESNTTSK
jgi:hypothetical protein